MTLTPIEQVQAAEAARLAAHFALNAKVVERDAGRLTNDNTAANLLNEQVGQLKRELLLAESRLAEAHEKVDAAQRAIRQAHNQVASLRNEASNHEKRRQQAQEQADSQQQLRDVALAALSRAEQALAVIEPPEQPAPPTAASGVSYAPPVLTVGGYNPRYYDRNKNEVRRNGSPLVTDDAPAVTRPMPSDENAPA